MQKLYYTISEVSKIVDEPQYVLRYWEKEFPLLKPKKEPCRKSYLLGERP